MTGVSHKVAGRVAGIVPASGSSLRMGQTKALLQMEGRTFVRCVVEALAEGGCAPVVVVTQGGDAVDDEARAAGAIVMTNPDPGDGPLTSFRLALESVASEVDGVVYHPVDHPLVRADTVRAMLAAAATSEAPIIIPSFDGERGHPSYFAATLFAEILDPGLEGGARTVVHRHLERALVVDVRDPGVITDIDTPDDYAAALPGGWPAPRGDA